MSIFSSLEHIQKRLPGFIRNDFGRKAAALLLAGMVCTYVRSHNEGTMETVTLEEVPVSIRLPSGYTMGNLKPTVRLGVKIPRNFHLDPREVVSREVTVQPSLIAKDQVTRIQLSRDSFRVPLGCFVETVSPDDLPLYIDYYNTKEIPVEAVFDPQYPIGKGYVAKVASVDPARVSVTGPDSLLKHLSSIRTEKIKLSDISQSFETYSLLEVPRGQEVKLSREKVLVRIDIRKKIRYQTFSGLEIAVLQGSGRTLGKTELLKHKTVSVRVAGDGERVAQLRKDQIKVFADVSHFDKPGIYHVDLGCWLSAEGVSIDSVSPKSIQVRVTK